MEFNILEHFKGLENLTQGPDFNAQKQVVAIEVRRLKERFLSANVKQLQFEVA